MTHLEKLKKCFDEIGVPFVEVDEDEYGYVSLYTTSEENQKLGRVDSSDGVFFEFCNGNLASSP